MENHSNYVSIINKHTDVKQEWFNLPTLIKFLHKLLLKYSTTCWPRDDEFIWQENRSYKLIKWNELFCTGWRMDSGIWRGDSCVCERSRPWSPSAPTKTGSSTHQVLSSRKLTLTPSTPQWHLENFISPFQLFFSFNHKEQKSAHCWTVILITQAIACSTWTLIQVK